MDNLRILPVMPPHHFILDENQHPVPVRDCMVWARWFEANLKNRIIAKTTINGATISTVFLGLNHNWHPDGPPILYETMIFDHRSFRDYQERYSTREEALSGHEEAVALVQKSVPKAANGN